MRNDWISSLKNFAIGTMLNVLLQGLFGFILNILLAFSFTMDILWLYRILIFALYWCILNGWIYGTSNKQRRYLDTLPRDHQTSMKEDYFAFLKQEGLPMILYYTVCMSLQVFVFGFTKGYFQAFFALLAPIGLDLSPIANWILSFLFFVVGYQAVAVIWRWRIRKEKYDFLFAKQQKSE